MKGIVLKPFPFAFDGNSFTHLKVGDEFPASGFSVSDGTFNGLSDTGYIRAIIPATSPDDIDLNRRLIDAIDKRLGGMSDEDLKFLIARRGTPFSGDMVRATIVSEAKVQLLAEYEGVTPIPSIDPTSEKAKEPSSATGQPAPAVAAVVTEKVTASDSDQQQDGDKQSDETVDDVAATGTTVDQALDAAKSNDLSEAELTTMNKAGLEAYATAKGIDVSQAKTKADYVDALKPKTEPAASGA